MGGCCSSGGGGGGSAGGGGAGPTAPKTDLNKSGVSDVKANSRSTAAATAAVASAEDLKARARRRAIQALVESLQHGETVIPSPKWRGQYLKTTAIGPAVVSAIVNYMKLKATQGASTTKPGRAKHHITTLDLRALRAGDDGFVEMMTALFDDTVVENVIFAGNEITDAGVRRLMTQLEKRSATGPSSPPVEGASAVKSSLPCALKFIGLTDNLITSGGIASLATVAPSFRRLEQLEVGRGQSGGGEDIDEVRDTLSLQDVKTIATYIQHTPALATFLYKGTGNYYARTGFSPDGFSLFVDTVVGHSALQELYLQDCYSTKPAMIGPVTVQAPRGKSNAGASPSSPVLDAPDSSWSAEDMQKSMASLSSALCVASSQLSTLVLRFPLSDDAVQTLARGLSRAPHLANLSLRGCDMSYKALGFIGDALGNNRVLHMLDVSYQASTIAHPAYLQELRSSSKRRFSYMGNGATAYSAAEIARQELSSGGSEVPSREERQHPLLPIIRSLHRNRSLAQLVMIGINISTEDVEELCACIERSGNKTLTEVWYTTAGNDALKMKLEDFLASNREYGEMANGGVGPSAVSSMRSSAVRVSGSSANFFPDSTSQSDRSESVSRSPPEKLSTVRNTNKSIPYSPAPAPLPIPHHPPRPGSGAATGTANGGDNASAERRASMSLSSVKLNLKSGSAAGAAGTTNGTTRSVGSAASPSQVSVTVDNEISRSAISQRSKTLRFTNSDHLLGSGVSADGTDEARTLPYNSQLPSVRKARAP